MKITRIKHPLKESEFIKIEEEDFEFVNPIDRYLESHVITNMTFLLPLFRDKSPIERKVLENILRKKAEAEFEKEYNQIISIHTPEELIKLLHTNKKSEQIKVIKKLQLKRIELKNFIFRAFLDYNYTFSQYIGEHYPNDFNLEALPTAAHNENGTLEVIGNTSLSDGKLKQIMSHRRRTIAKFIDNGKNWHCFFSTSKGLRGEENYKGGTPHLHYISDKWNIDRAEVVKQLKSNRYSFKALHVDYIR
jgi:hypothetical protein